MKTNRFSAQKLIVWDSHYLKAGKNSRVKRKNVKNDIT